MKNSGLSQFQNMVQTPDQVTAVVLSSGTGQAFDVPATARAVAFSFNSDFWVRYGSTGAAVPTTSSTAATGSELNPTARQFGSTQTTTGISVVSDSAAKGSISWWS